MGQVRGLAEKGVSLPAQPAEVGDVCHRHEFHLVIDALAVQPRQQLVLHPRLGTHFEVNQADQALQAVVAGGGPVVRSAGQGRGSAVQGRVEAQGRGSGEGFRGRGRVRGR